MTTENGAQPLPRHWREYVLLAIGVGYCVFEAQSPSPIWLHFGVYLLATVLFAVRFFPARALGVGVALGALAQRLPHLRYDLTELTIVHTWVAVIAIGLLASPALEARFERSPSKLRWFPNTWAALPWRDMAVLRGCAYALGILAAMIAATMPWPIGIYFADTLALGFLVAVVGLIVLLAAGRAPALLLVPLVCVPMAILLAQLVPEAEAAIAGYLYLYVDGSFVSPEFVLPMLVTCVVATLLALPHGVRLIRRAWAND